MYLVTVRATFSAAHRLYRPELTDDENALLYGKCSNPNGHGHNYHLGIAVSGDIDEATGMVVNFFEIKQALDQHILSVVDHTNLNVDVDFMAGLVPTAENLARKFWEILATHTGRSQLYSISISEGSTNRITYYGPGAALPVRGTE